MEKLINKIMSFRGPEWRPFAIEVSEDDIRVAVFGGATGFTEPPTAETAPHQDLESCLLEAIDLLEHSRLLSPSREPYHRLPHHRCVFFQGFHSPTRGIEIRRRALLRAVPRAGDWIKFGSSEATHDEILVKAVFWKVYDDEVHLWSALREMADEDLDGRVTPYLENGWEVAREYKWPEDKPHGE